MTSPDAGQHRYEVMVSRDVQKKRKKWEDAIMEYDAATKMAKVTQIPEMDNTAKRVFFAGNVDHAKHAAIVAGDDGEIRLGGIVITIMQCLHEPQSSNVHVVPTCNPVALQAHTGTGTGTAARKFVIPVSHQPPSRASALLMGAQQPLKPFQPVRSNAASMVPALTPAPVPVPQTGPSLQVGLIASGATDRKIGTSNGVYQSNNGDQLQHEAPDHPSHGDGEVLKIDENRPVYANATSSSSTSSLQHNQKKPFSVPRSTAPNITSGCFQAHRDTKALSSPASFPVCYGKHTRKARLSVVYDNMGKYFQDFLLALNEELFVSLSQVLNSLEAKCIDIANKNRSQRQLAISSSTSRFPMPLLKSTALNKPVDFARTEGMLRAANIVCCSNIEVILSKLSNTQETSSASSKQQKRWKGASSRTMDDGDDSDNNNSNNGKYETFNASNASAAFSSVVNSDRKIYLKFSISQKDIPRDAERLAKGDVWVLWKSGAELFCPNDIYRAMDSSAEMTIEDIDKLQSEYRELTSGQQAIYSLPWFKGICWQEIWVVRALWHTFSDKNMLEIAPLFSDGTQNLNILGLDTSSHSTGKKSSQPASKFNGIRLTNEMNSVAVLDLLASGVKFCADSFLSDSSTLSCLDLLQSRSFVEGVLMNAPNSCHSLPVSIVRPSPLLISSSPLPAPLPELPKLPTSVIETFFSCITGQFQLNDDQRSVLRDVSRWFLEENDSSSRKSGGPPTTTTGYEISQDRSKNNIMIVHGVFGSGKSHLIVAICAFVKLVQSRLSATRAKSGKPGARDDHKLRILVSSNTNVAVDRIMLALAAFSVSDDSLVMAPQIARVGCATKIDRGLRKHLVSMTENRQAAQREIRELIRKGDTDPLLQQLLDKTNKVNFADLQRQAIADADVIGVTCSSASSCFLHQVFCPIVILDESTQMTEPVSLLPIACARPAKMLLVGDPNQLPPTIAMGPSTHHENVAFGASAGSSTSAMTAGASRLGGQGPAQKSVVTDNLARTLFDRLSQMGFPHIVLRTQYRCHPLIANICSELFYQGQLINGASAASRPAFIRGLPPVSAIEISGKESRFGDSFVNFPEATAVKELIFWTLRANSILKPTIGVICLYKAQATLISKLFREDPASVDLLYKDEGHTSQVKISTVDAFQGQENDVIVIATTKCQWNSFISNAARVNVAISRARNHLIIVGVKGMFEVAPLWSRVMLSATCKASSVKELSELSMDACYAEEMDNIVHQHNIQGQIPSVIPSAVNRTSDVNSADASSLPAGRSAIQLTNLDGLGCISSALLGDTGLPTVPESNPVNSFDHAPDSDDDQPSPRPPLLSRSVARPINAPSMNSSRNDTVRGYSSGIVIKRVLR